MSKKHNEIEINEQCKNCGGKANAIFVRHKGIQIGVGNVYSYEIIVYCEHCFHYTDLGMYEFEKLPRGYKSKALGRCNEFIERRFYKNKKKREIKETKHNEIKINEQCQNCGAKATALFIQGNDYFANPPGTMCEWTIIVYCKYCFHYKPLGKYEFEKLPRGYRRKAHSFSNWLAKKQFYRKLNTRAIKV